MWTTMRQKATAEGRKAFIINRTTATAIVIGITNSFNTFKLIPFIILMNYLDILCFSIAALQLMVYKACASSLLQRPNPVPSRLSRGTGRDGTGRVFSKDHGIAATLDVIHDLVCLLDHFCLGDSQFYVFFTKA